MMFVKKQYYLLDTPVFVGSSILQILKQ